MDGVEYSRGRIASVGQCVQDNVCLALSPPEVIRMQVSDPFELLQPRYGALGAMASTSTHAMCHKICIAAVPIRMALSDAAWLMQHQLAHDT